MNKKLLSKVLSLFVCIAMVFGAVVNAGAASTDTEAAAASSDPGFKLLSSTVKIQNNQIYASAYNVSASSIFYIEYSGKDSGSYRLKFSDLAASGSQILNLPATQNYIFKLGYTVGSGGGSGSNGSYKSYNTSGGTYQKVRIRLSDFSSYFNSDGSHTDINSTFGTHDYKFGVVETTANGKFYGGLCFKNNGTVTAVTPNSNGEVEIYVSTEIGVPTQYCTEFHYEYQNANGSITSGSGGGSTGSSLYSLTKGNADSTGSVDIKDAAKVQLYLAKLDTLNDLQKFTANVDGDNSITIKDAATIQLWLADLL